MRLIDADALKEHKVYSYERHEYVVPVLNIDNAPTVELFCAYLSDGEVRQPCVESPCKHERPKGEWLSLSDVSPSGFGTWVCSQCGHGFRGIKSKMPYCTCGADMRGAEE